MGFGLGSKSWSSKVELRLNSILINRCGAEFDESSIQVSLTRQFHAQDRAQNAVNSFTWMLQKFEEPGHGPSLAGSQLKKVCPFQLVTSPLFVTFKDTFLSWLVLKIIFLEYLMAEYYDLEILFLIFPWLNIWLISLTTRETKGQRSKFDDKKSVLLALQLFHVRPNPIKHFSMNSCTTPNSNKMSRDFEMTLWLDAFGDE